MRKLCRICVVVLILSFILCGCSAAQQTGLNNGIVVTASLKDKPVIVGDIPCEFPLVNEPASMKMLAFRSCDIDFEDVFVWKKYEEMTGVDVNWTTTTKKERAEAVYTALMNKEQLDLILRCKVSSSRLIQYGESGLILNLNEDDMLKNYAPNCWAYLQSHPDTLASITNPDGSIYSLPQVNSGAELRVSRKIFINKKWLDNVGMELPTTTEEMYRILKAFKEKDANGNGDPNDEIPLSAQDWMSIQEAFSGAFGIMNRGVHNAGVDCDESTGKVRLTAMSDGYRNFLEYFRKLYAEGLISSNIFDITSEEWKNIADNDRIGVYTNTNLASFSDQQAGNWVGIEQALEGPTGDKLWSAVRANYHSEGNAVIPATCSNPELVLRWLDYFWTDEGTLFYHMGIEGETFEVKGDGSYDYMPYIYDEIKDTNSTFDNVVAKYSPYPGGGNPTVEVVPYFMGGEMAAVPAATARALFEYKPSECWPCFTFTAEENEKISVIKTDITKFIDGRMVDFITGASDLSQWDDYLDQLSKFDTDRYIGIFQAALDRYRAMDN